MPFPAGTVPVTQSQSGVDPKTLHAMLLMQQMKQQQQQQAQVQAHARSLGAMGNLGPGQSGISTNGGPQPCKIKTFHKLKCSLFYASPVE